MRDTHWVPLSKRKVKAAIPAGMLCYHQSYIDASWGIGSDTHLIVSVSPPKDEKLIYFDYVPR
jgi:hypothetical protein